MLPLATIAAGATVLAPAGNAPAVAMQPGVQIIHNDAVAVTFDKAKCQVAKKHGKTQFKAISKSHGWKLDVRLNDFKGYSDYQIQYGMGVNNFWLTSPDGTSYTNIYRPTSPCLPREGPRRSRMATKRCWGSGSSRRSALRGPSTGRTA